MKTVLIIQARMGSKRLPGKMCMDLLGKPVLAHVIDRVKKCTQVDKIVLATSINENNSVLVELANKLGIESYQGSENDVLDRFYQCAKTFEGDLLVRITGDCPLIDPYIIDSILKLYKQSDVDYVSNSLPPTFPDGFDVEVFSFTVLKKAWEESKLQSEREHVTPYIRKHPDKFKIINFTNKDDLSDLRLTLDEPEDLKLLKELLLNLNDDFRLKDVVEFIKLNPEIMKINQGFERNEGYLNSLRKDKGE